LPNVIVAAAGVAIAASDAAASKASLRMKPPLFRGSVAAPFDAASCVAPITAPTRESRTIKIALTLHLPTVKSLFAIFVSIQDICR
jgi:hypothetical protein